MSETYEFSKILSKICDNYLSPNDIEKVLPKLKIVCNVLNIQGKEVVKIIELLVKMNKQNRLETVNSESIDLVNYLYNVQIMLTGYPELTCYEIMKHIFTPYQLNKCDEGINVYEYQSRFEIMLKVIEDGVIYNKNFHMLLMLGKYNKPLSDVALLISKYDGILEKEEKVTPLLMETISRIFGVFYFNQDKYENDVKMVEEITKRIIDNPEVFDDYCKEEGICTFPLYLDDIKKTYGGTIKLLDSAYEKKKEDKRESK